MIAHLEAENDHTEAATAHLADLRNALFAEFKTRIKETDLSVPVEKDGWSYYSRTEEGQPYGVHCRRSLVGDDPGTNPEMVILDENLEAEASEYFEIGVFDVSPDHRLMLWAADRSGDEKFELRIRDLDKGTELDDVIPDVSYGSAWAMDNRTFFYVRVDDAHRPFQVWRHRLGDPVADDHLVFEELDERFFVGVGRERDDSFIQIALSSAITDETWLLPADQPDTPLRCFAERRNGIEYGVSHHEGRFIVLTNDGAENFRICETPADDTDPARWVDLVPHRSDVHVSGFDALREHLVIFERVDAVTRMRVQRWDTGEEHVIAQAEAVSTVWPGANPTADTTTYRYGYSSMVTPPAVLRYDLDERTTEVLKTTEVLGGFDPATYETKTGVGDCRRWRAHPHEPCVASRSTRRPGACAGRCLRRLRGLVRSVVLDDASLIAGPWVRRCHRTCSRRRRTRSGVVSRRQVREEAKHVLRHRRLRPPPHRRRLDHSGSARPTRRVGGRPARRGRSEPGPRTVRRRGGAGAVRRCAEHDARSRPCHSP